MASIIGTVDNPNPNLGDIGRGGLAQLLNNGLRILFIAAGLYTFILILVGGAEYIGAGDNPQKLADARNKIFYALIGLVVLVSSFIIAVAIGQLFFGDPTAILFPTIQRGTPTP